MLSIFSCVYWPLVHFLWRAVLLDLLLIVIGQCCPVSICFNRVQLFVTPWNVAHQAPLSMGFCRQEYWGGFPCPPSGDLPNPGIKLASLTSPALASRFFTTSTTWEAAVGCTGS